MPSGQCLPSAGIFPKWFHSIEWAPPSSVRLFLRFSRSAALLTWTPRGKFFSNAGSLTTMLFYDDIRLVLVLLVIDYTCTFFFFGRSVLLPDDLGSTRSIKIGLVLPNLPAGFQV